ncbi:hypothetical protein B7P43_G06778 [Cryptotermes secundus]|nr:hypothetical protein B7P43_G06778 [Cryptotermes secundus]
MTGKSVAAYSTQAAEGNTTNAENAIYSPMEVATAVAFMVGIYQLLMYVFRMGIVCTLLSDTLVNGFTTGAAIHVLTSQVKDLLGLKITRYEGPFNIGFAYIEIFNKIEEVNTAALVVSSITIIVLAINNEILKPLVRKRSVIPIPIELMAVIIGTLVSTYINLQDEYGLQPVGDIPTG